MFSKRDGSIIAHGWDKMEIPAKGQSSMSIPAQRQNEVYLRRLRLFLEEICCNLHRFRHAAEGGIEPPHVRINQEYSLGIPDTFADIRVEVAGAPPYFIEVKYGYSPARTVASLTRKYGPGARLGEASKIVVVGDANLAASWGDIEPRKSAPACRTN